jgi:hypothetical protein
VRGRTREALLLHPTTRTALCCNIEKSGPYGTKKSAVTANIEGNAAWAINVIRSNIDCLRIGTGYLMLCISSLPQQSSRHHAFDLPLLPTTQRTPAVTVDASIIAVNGILMVVSCCSMKEAWWLEGDGCRALQPAEMLVLGRLSLARAT